MQLDGTSDRFASKDLYGACWCQVVSFSVSPGRSRAVGRSPGAHRDRGRRWPGVLSANLDPSRLSGKLSSQARYSSCRAISAATAAAQRLGRGGRRGAGATGGGPVCWRSLARRRACRSAAVSGASWMRCLGILISVVKRDCHVSRVARASVGLSFDDKRLLASDRPRGVRQKGANIAPQTCIRWALLRAEP